MIYKEKLKIFFTIIITLVVRVDCNFIDEVYVAIEKLQDTVDKISLENAKISLENAKTTEKVDKLLADVTIMKEANSKSFEKLDQLNKMIMNIEGKVDAASDATVLVRTKIDDVDNRLEENNNILKKLEKDTQSLSFEMNTSFADLDNKLSNLEINLIEGNNAVIQKVSKIDLEKLREEQSKSFENVNRLHNELKTLNLNMSSKLEEVCNDNLVAIRSKVTVLSRSGGCSNNVIG